MSGAEAQYLATPVTPAISVGIGVLTTWSRSHGNWPVSRSTTATRVEVVAGAALAGEPAMVAMMGIEAVTTAVAATAAKRLRPSITAAPTRGLAPASIIMAAFGDRFKSANGLRDRDTGRCR